MLKYIKTEKAPAAIGPYSQAVVHNDLVYCSGQIAIDPQTQQFLDEDIKTQTTQVLDNLKNVLEAAGSSLEKAIKVTIYLASMDDFAVVNEIYGEYFTSKPARATVAVQTLPKNALVEIDCVAAV